MVCVPVVVVSVVGAEGWGISGKRKELLGSRHDVSVSSRFAAPFQFHMCQQQENIKWEKTAELGSKPVPLSVGNSRAVEQGAGLKWRAAAGPASGRGWVRHSARPEWSQGMALAGPLLLL